MKVLCLEDKITATPNFLISRNSVTTIMVDVTDIPDARVGVEVVLIGRQGDEEILPDEIAANGNTINYEIVCKISPRVTRVFIQT